MNDQENFQSHKLHISFLKTGDAHLRSRWKTMGRHWRRIWIQEQKNAETGKNLDLHDALQKRRGMFSSEKRKWAISSSQKKKDTHLPFPKWKLSLTPLKILWLHNIWKVLIPLSCIFSKDFKELLIWQQNNSVYNPYFSYILSYQKNLY